MGDPHIEKEPRFIDLFSAEFENRIKAEGKKYRRKIQPINGAEQIAKQVTVETRLPDGTLESKQDAKSGDWIITGSKGERFVFTDKKFHDLYKSDDTGHWLPRERKIIVILNPFRESVRILAPWGTAAKPAYQNGSEKAVLVAEIDEGGNMTRDRYIIGNQEMLLNNYDPI